MAAMMLKKSDSRAAFWSITLSLITVIVWKIVADSGVGGIFAIEPLWPGLAVSTLTFVILHVIGPEARLAHDQ